MYVLSLFSMQSWTREVRKITQREYSGMTACLSIKHNYNNICLISDYTNCSLLNVGCALSENKDIAASQMCAANKGIGLITYFILIENLKI